jgi:hypothetical protein
MAGPSVTHMEVNLADNCSPPYASQRLWDPGPTVFDPDCILSRALLLQLAAATSTSSRNLFRFFVQQGAVISSESSIRFDRALLDSGAQGCNFISLLLYNRLPRSLTDHSVPVNRVVRLGDARSVTVSLELPLTIRFRDSKGVSHQHTLLYCVLDGLSHDVIIGLIDLLGVYYDLFEDSVTASRALSLTTALSNQLLSLTSEVQQLTASPIPSQSLRTTRHLTQHHQHYHDTKMNMCSSSRTVIQPLVLQDGSCADVLLHPRHGVAFADNRVELFFNSLTSLLVTPQPGAIVSPW